MNKIKEKFPEICHFIENPKEYELLYYREDHIHNEYALDIEEAKRIIKYIDKTKALNDMCLKNIVITTKRKNDLEQALDEIEKIILKATIDEETGKDLGYSDNIPYYNLLKIIQKTKGDSKNEN